MVYDIGAEQSLESIFAGILIGGINRNPTGLSASEMEDYKEMLRVKGKTYYRNLGVFLREFPYNCFQDSYAFLYEVVKTVGVKNFSVTQLESLVDSHRDLVLDSPYIDLAKYSVTATGGASRDDEIVEAFKLDTKQLFVDLSNRAVSAEEFDSSVKVFKDFYINQRSLEIAQNCTMILSQDGFYDKQPNHRQKLLRGLEDQREYYSREHQKLKLLQEGEGSKDFSVNADWLKKEADEDNDKGADFLANFGLAAMDEAMGGMRKRRMYGILGPTKGGKTRFTNYLVAQILKAGYNVAVWPLEGQPDEWTAMQTAAILHNEWGLNIGSNIIVDRRYGYAEEQGTSAEAVRTKIAAAKTILALGPEDITGDTKRGKLSFITGTAYVEDFLDVIKNHYLNENPFDCLVMDQVVNIQGRAGRQSKVERISDAYQRLHLFIQNDLHCCVLAPAQLKQSTIDYMRTHKDETIDVTAGGESSETIRTPDEVIGLMSDKEELKGGIMRFCHVASRHGAAFDDFVARAELGWVSFRDDAGLNSY